MSRTPRWTAVIVAATFTLGLTCLPEDFWVALSGEVINGMIINLVFPSLPASGFGPV